MITTETSTKEQDWKEDRANMLEVEDDGYFFADDDAEDDAEDEGIMFDAEATAQAEIDSVNAESEASRKLTCKEMQAERNAKFDAVTRANMHTLRDEFLARANGFNAEYKERVTRALSDVKLEFHAIRNAYFAAIRFPMYLSCDARLRTTEDAVQLGYAVEILTGEKLTSIADDPDDYTNCRVIAEIETVIMKHLTEKILTA